MLCFPEHDYSKASSDSSSNEALVERSLFYSLPMKKW